MARIRPTDDILAGGPPREAHRVTTSRTEVLHLLIAAAVLTVDIALVRTQISVVGVPEGLNATAFLDGLGVAAVAALSGFVAHEMAHKVVAQRHGFWAEFRMSPTGLLLSVPMALFGFLFALPGATLIGGMGDIREWGRTSLAGPLVNLGEGAVFLAVAFATVPVLDSPWVWVSLTFLALVNGIFASFNLLPIGPLDGRKVPPVEAGGSGSARSGSRSSSRRACSASSSSSSRRSELERCRRSLPESSDRDGSSSTCGSEIRRGSLRATYSRATADGRWSRPVQRRASARCVPEWRRRASRRSTSEGSS